ncbi:MAG: hypothetical protein VR69_05530 [Peptococcaceae bacterium BRH_c4b]|nr:MAG: hypothetical protein VR69_05530 [Peptococcaceae bacterium BRH_c4b]
MKKGFLRGVIAGAMMGAFAGLFMKPQRKMEVKDLKQLADTGAWQKSAQNLVQGISRRVNRMK